VCNLSLCSNGAPRLTLPYSTHITSHTVWLLRATKSGTTIHLRRNRLSRQTDVRRASSLNASYPRGGHNNDNKPCERPPQYAPPLHVDLWPFDLLTLKVVSESRLPILVFLGLSVLDLDPMYATDRQIDVKTSDTHHRLMPPHCGGGAGIIIEFIIAPYGRNLRCAGRIGVH